MIKKIQRIGGIGSTVSFFYLFLCFYLIGFNAFSKNYSIVNYRVEQGFAATNAYGLLEDSIGYLWIGSENGVFRFNGSGFKKYTTHDGLPDNEILSFIKGPDSKIWMLPFSGTLCYMQHGQIFSEANDPLLKKLRLDSKPETIFFDKYRNLWVASGSEFIRVDREGAIHHVAYPPDMISKGRWFNETAGELQVLVNDTIYAYENGSFVFRKIFNKCNTGSGSDLISGNFFLSETDHLFFYGIRELDYKPLPLIPAIGHDIYVFAINLLSPDEVVFCTSKGAFIYNLHTGRLISHFLPDCKIGHCIRTRDGSLWIATSGKGLFRIRSAAVKTLTCAMTQDVPVIFIKGTEKAIQAITANAVQVRAERQQEDRYHVAGTLLDPDRRYIHYMYTTRNRKGQFLGFSDRISLRNSLVGKPLKEYRPTTKVVLEEGPAQVLVGSTTGVFRFNTESFMISDTMLFQTRITALAKMNDTVYAGTLDGLQAGCPKAKGFRVLPGSHPLQGHLTALAADSANHTLWVANNKAELVGIRNGKIIAVKGWKDGLQCSRISAIAMSDRSIWIATDNGLFAITRNSPYTVLKHINATSGLCSDQVNCLSVCSNRVWAGTAKGINYFDENQIPVSGRKCSFVVNSIKNGDRILFPSGNILQLHNRPLDIDLDIIDFEGGDIPVFQYRIDNGEWLDMEGSHLYFPSVPYGDFRLSVRNLGPGIHSTLVFQQAFYNPAPLYKRTWVQAILWFLLSAFTGLIVFYFLRKARKRERERLSMQQNLLLLEQMALQSQMNPHFIFNCITAIKQYYNAGDKDRGNDFVDSFSMLIRHTFEQGTEVFTSLDKELGYLRRYLDVEQSRFNHSFHYDISCHTATAVQDIPVPAMLLQPVLENAIRHGIRHLSHGRGVVQLIVTERDKMISIAITDNGIGIQKSRDLKGENLLQSLTSSTVNNRRVDVLNRLFAQSISMHMEDIATGGTCVIISYPTDINKDYHERYHH